jgi:hypothetical protein
VNIAQKGVTEIDDSTISERLAVLTYPLQFLDYETFNNVIPDRDGIRPYQQMAFQYSLHTMREPGRPCEHTYFLSEGDGHPPLEMAKKLRSDMGEIGTVIVWSQGFENTINKHIAESHPEFAGFFGEVIAKTFDLRKIFSDQLYMHPEFKGRDSIKKVLPVLVPELSYKDLDIREGMTASISWFRMVDGRYADMEREQVHRALLDYCHRDTEAMVEIFNVLRTCTRKESPI